MICPNCQKEIADHSNFCYNCGARLVASAPAPAYCAPTSKRLTRSTSNKKIAGVCGGCMPTIGAPGCGATLAVGADHHRGRHYRDVIQIDLRNPKRRSV